MPPGGGHKVVKGWLHEARVLLNHTSHIPASCGHVSLYPAHVVSLQDGFRETVSGQQVITKLLQANRPVSGGVLRSA